MLFFMQEKFVLKACLTVTFTFVISHNKPPRVLQLRGGKFPSFLCNRVEQTGGLLKQNKGRKGRPKANGEYLPAVVGAAPVEPWNVTSEGWCPHFRRAWSTPRLKTNKARCVRQGRKTIGFFWWPPQQKRPILYKVSHFVFSLLDSECVADAAASIISPSLQEKSFN